MGRNKAYDAYIKDKRRDKILSCALKLFAKNGLVSTKITDIAAAANISHGLLYHYFSSKEELYTELIRTAFEKLNTACRDLEQHPSSPRDKILMTLDALLKGFHEHEDTAFYHMVIAQASISDATPRDTQELIRQARTLPYDVMSRIFREGQRDGSVVAQDPYLLAVMFWAMVKGLAMHLAAWGPGTELPEAAVISAAFLKN